MAVVGGRGKNYAPPASIPALGKGRGANYASVGGGSSMAVREMHGGLPVHKYIKPDPYTNTYKLYVKSIPIHYDQKSLWNLFSKFSTPTSVFVSGPQRGHPCQFGFVEFHTYKECATIMQAINGNSLSDGITCEFAKEKPDVSQFQVDSDEELEPDLDWTFKGKKINPLKIKMIVENDIPLSSTLPVKAVKFPIVNYEELHNILFKAVVKVDDQTPSKEKCAACQSVGGRRGCSACGTVYCSRSCFDTDEPAHRRICSPAQSLGGGGGDVSRSRDSLTNGFHNSSVNGNDSSFGNRSGGGDRSFNRSSSDRFQGQQREDRSGGGDRSFNRSSSDRFQGQQHDNRSPNMFEKRKSRFENDRRSDQGPFNSPNEGRFQNRKSDSRQRNDAEDSWNAPKEVTEEQNTNETLPIRVQFFNQLDLLSSKPCETPKTGPAHDKQTNSFTTSTPKTDVVSSPKTPSSGLQPGVSQTVMVTVEEGQGVYNIQTAEQLVKANQMQTELALLDQNKPSPLGSPVLDGVCCAKYEDYWSRCRVVNLKPLQVLFIDYGNVENTTQDQLFALPADLMATPPLVHKIKLADGTPQEYLMKIMGEQLVIKPVVKQGDLWISHVDGVNYPTAATPSEATPSKPAPTTPSAPVTAPTTPSAPVTPILTTPLTPASATFSSPAVPQSGPKQLVPDVYNEVMIKHRVGKNKLSVVPLKNVPTLQALMVKLQKLASSQDVVTPEVGMKCIVKNSTDMQWYRGRVMNLNPLSVKLVDQGLLQVSSPHIIRSIPEEVAGVLPFVCTVQPKEGTPQEILEKDIVSVKVLHLDPQSKAWVVDVVPVSNSESVTSVNKPTPTTQNGPERPAAGKPTTQTEPEFPGIFTPNQFTTVIVTSQAIKDNKGNIAYTVGPKDLMSRIMAMHEYFDADASKNVSLTPNPGAVGIHLFYGIWHRVKVNSVEPLRVYYMDYGSSEELKTPEGLKRCPESHKSMKRLICRIQLAPGTHVKYHTLPEESELSVKPIEKLPDNTVVVHVEGETYTEAQTSPVKGPAVQAPVVQPPAVQAPVVQPTAVQAQQVPEYPDILEEAEKFTSVVITYPDPSEKDAYYVGGSTVMADYMTLMEELMAEKDNYQSLQPQVGDSCVALYEDIWNRGKVVSVSPLRVWFMDYGNTEELTLQMVRKCPEKWESKSPLVSRIKLAPGTDSKWFGLAEDTALSVKPVAEFSDGTVLVHVEGEVYPEEATPSPAGSSASESPAVPILNLLQEGFNFYFVIEEVNSRLNHLLGPLGSLNVPESNFYLEDSDAFEKVLNEAPKDPSFRPEEGEYIGMSIEGVWLRAQVINKDKQLAVLLDNGRVRKYGEVVRLPKEVTGFPYLATVFTLETHTPELFEKTAADNFEGTVTTLERYASGKVKSALVKLKNGVVGRINAWSYNPLMKPDPLNNGDLVIITEVVDSSTFMVRRDMDEAEKEEIQKMQIECIYSKELKFETPPQVGDFAVHETRGTLPNSRVRIEEMNSVTGQCLLYDIDQGTTFRSNLSKLSPITPTLTKIPCKAVRVHLNNVDKKERSEEFDIVVEHYITKAKPLKLEFHDGKVILRVPKDNTVINEVLQSHLQPNVCMDGDKFTLRSLPPAKLPMNQEVVVTPGQEEPLYLQVASEMGAYFTDKHEDLQTYCQAETASYRPASNELCLAKFPEDQSFYRCQCVQESTEGISNLQLIDFGNFFKAPIADIRKIPDMFLQWPVMGFRSEISGVSEERKAEILPTLKLYSNHKVVFKSVDDVGKYFFEYISQV